MQACEVARGYTAARLQAIKARRDFITSHYSIDFPAARHAVDALDSERRSVLNHYRGYIGELKWANRGLALKGSAERWV